MDKGNIILITIDSFRHDFRRLCGVDLPNLERFISESGVFENAYSAAPATRGAFSSLFSSTYPSMYGGKTYIANDRITLAEVLRDAGWKTFGFHSNPLLSKLFNYNKGFDVFYDNTSMDKQLKAKGAIMFNKILRLVKMQAYMSAEHLNQQVMNTLNGCLTTKKDFFLWIHYMDVHGPYYGKARNLPIAKLFYEVRWQKAIRSKPRMRLTQNLFADYAHELKYLDHCFGEMIEFFKSKDIYDNSTIVLMADHGEGFGEHGYYSHPQKLYNELIRIPLIIKFPLQYDFSADTKKLVSSLDIAPTLLHLNNLKVPKTFLGRSILNSIENEYVFSEADSQDVKEQKLFAIISKQWKYILETKDGSEELYELMEDPLERKNLKNVCANQLGVMRNILRDYQELVKKDKAPEIKLDEDNYSEEMRARLKTLGYL